MLEPPRERRPSAPGSGPVDIVTLGYAISIEHAIGMFDSIRQDIRSALGLEGTASGIPDPGKAAAPGLLWPALGLAFDPRSAIPAWAVLLAALSLRWPFGLATGETGVGTVAGLAGPAIAAVAVAIAAALATSAAAAASHEMIAEGGRLSVRDRGRALRRRPALFLGAARDAGLRIAMAAILAVTVAILTGLENGGALGAAISRLSTPLQVLLTASVLGLTLSAIYRLLAQAAMAPRAQGLLMIQAALEVRRISGDRDLVPSRPLAPALGAALGLAIVLGVAARLIGDTWDVLGAAGGTFHPFARAFGRDIIWSAAGGVFCNYLGVTGLLAGYALGTGAPHEPVRAPEIITGTWGAGLRVNVEPESESDPGPRQE